MHRFLFMVFAALYGCVANGASGQPAPALMEEIFQFEAQSGDIVDAYRGAFQVPENRADPNSRLLTLHYIRFPAREGASGSPTVYLAGGPGGSGTWFAGSWRFPLFMAFREFGDVIALDQRGTGKSADAPTCTSSRTINYNAAISDADFVEAHQQALRECLAFWREENIDPSGYSTLESVADLDALRKHLGAEKLNLWGISYGSHLSLAALKESDEHIDRVVIASVEGLDQTIKLPSRTDAYFGRLSDALNASAQADGKRVDVEQLIRRVHAKLDRAPITLQLENETTVPTEVIFQKREMQRLASAMIADPNRFARQLIEIYLALDRGDAALLNSYAQEGLDLGAPISFEIMPVMMDIASGVSASRAEQIKSESEDALLGPWLNDTLYLLDAAPGFDLGDDFRSTPQSDRPVLVLSGTLDGRTYIKSHQEAVLGLRNTQSVTIHNGGHNLFMVSPEVTSIIMDFMRGEDVSGREVTIDAPSLD